MPRHKTAAKLRRASSSPKKARYRGSEKRMAVGSPELRKLISRKQKARWRRHFAEHPETPRKPRRAKLPHDEVHERRATSHRKPVVGISVRTGERLRFNSMQAAAEHLFAQGETSSVVAAQLIISQVCNGRRRTGFGYYWEFPHRGRPMTLEMRRRKSGQKREKNSRADKKILKKLFGSNRTESALEISQQRFRPIKTGVKRTLRADEKVGKPLSPKSVTGTCGAASDFGKIYAQGRIGSSSGDE